MQVFRSLSALQRVTRTEAHGCVATIGAYDGLHRGHQAIIAEVRDRARALGVPSVVFSFEPLPREYFGGDDPPGRLTRFRERVELMRSLGVERFFCARFDDAMRCIDTREFIEQMLVDGVRPRCVVVGDDFRFARQRAGTVADLRTAGTRHGFDVVQVCSVYVDGDRVSSSAIREALARGEFARAARMLGRPWTMRGRVRPGRRLGRTLGFPTANVDPGRRRCPVSGIFAVRVLGIDDSAREAVASVGTRPTVDGGGAPLLEVHVFDFDGDLYGRLIEVEFVARLRDELKFDSLEALTEQMHRDCDAARRIFAA